MLWRRHGAAPFLEAPSREQSLILLPRWVHGWLLLFMRLFRVSAVVLSQGAKSSEVIVFEGLPLGSWRQGPAAL